MNFNISNVHSETSNFNEESHDSTSKQRINTLWTKEENVVYIEFLKENRDIFVTQEIRRHKKVFIQLSKMMPTRTSDQCRSHHQKMMISHKSIDKIIKHLNKKINKKSKKSKKEALQTQVQTPMQSQSQVLEVVKCNETQQVGQLNLQMKKSISYNSSQRDLWDVLA